MKLLVLVDCSLTTKVKSVPAGAWVHSPAAVQLHASLWHRWRQGWQAPWQKNHTGLHSQMAQVSRSRVLTLLGAAIMLVLPRTAAVKCRSPRGDLQASNYVTRSLAPLVAQERAVPRSPHGRVGSWRAARARSASAPRLCARSWGLAALTLHSYKPRAVEQLDLRLSGLFHLCLVQAARKTFKAPAGLQILMFLALGNLNGETVPKKLIWKPELFSWVRNQSGIWRKTVSESMRVFHIQLNPSCVTRKLKWNSVLSKHSWPAPSEMCFVSLCRLIMHLQNSVKIYLLISMAQFKNLSLQPNKCGVPSEFHGQVRRQGWEKTWSGDKFLIYACKQ